MYLINADNRNTYAEGMTASYLETAASYLETAASPRTWKGLVCSPVAERFKISFTTGSFPNTKF